MSMIRCQHYSVILILLFYSILYPRIIGAQVVPSIYFSAMGSSSTGSLLISNPLAGSLSSDCLQIDLGLLAHYAEKNIGIFSIDCADPSDTSHVELIFYPNPVHSYAILKLTSSLPANSNIQLLIVDAMGRLVRNQILLFNQLQNGFSLDIRLLSSGTYFIVIRNSRVNKGIKFIKI